MTTVPVATRRAPAARWVPFALIALTLLPALKGILELTGLAGGPTVLPTDPRIGVSPSPVVVHIVATIPYAVLGAFQFSTSLRRSWPAWHRVAGRLLVVLGLLVALSGVWMVVDYPMKAGTGPLLLALRLVVGAAMAASIVLGVLAIRRRDVMHHQAWMTRAYALALGAGTQVFTGAVVATLPGAGVLAHDLGMGAGWLINLGVAEYVLRRGRRLGRASAGGPAPVRGMP